jgi:hypothetical protein
MVGIMKLNTLDTNNITNRISVLLIAPEMVITSDLSVRESWEVCSDFSLSSLRIGFFELKNEFDISVFYNGNLLTRPQI